VAGRIWSIEKIHLIGTRTCDLPAYGIVPLPLAGHSEIIVSLNMHTMDLKFWKDTLTNKKCFYLDTTFLKHQTAIPTKPQDSSTATY
jgi:hypothetical protein